MIWVGVCGLEDREEDVLRQLDAVEIQETFDRPMSVDQAAIWRSRAPPAFRFCVKGSRLVTHGAAPPTPRRPGQIAPDADREASGGFQDTNRVAEGWETTRSIAEALHAEVIRFEVPDTFGPSETNRAALYRFFETIRTPAVRAVELPRSWATHVVEKICEDLDLIHAVDPFEREPATYGLAYFRLHRNAPGPSRTTDPYAEDDFARLRAIGFEYDDAYVMFDNVTKTADALRFRESLHADVERERAAQK